MATASDPQTTNVVSEPRFVIHAVNWAWYQKMLDLVGDRPCPRITYDRGTLELMSPSLSREEFANLFGRFIATVTEELDIPCRDPGSTTWKNQTVDRGLEADESFYLANAYRMEGKRDTVNLNVDPPPDLAIEIEVTRSALNRMAIYASLGVPEVWRFDGERLLVEKLVGESYVKADHSDAFPFLQLEEVVHWMGAGGSAKNHSAWNKRLRRWVRNELVPRVPGREDTEVEEDE